MQFFYSFVRESKPETLNLLTRQTKIKKVSIEVKGERKTKQEEEGRKKFCILFVPSGPILKRYNFDSRELL